MVKSEFQLNNRWRRHFFAGSMTSYFFSLGLALTSWQAYSIFIWWWQVDLRLDKFKSNTEKRTLHTSLFWNSQRNSFPWKQEVRRKWRWCTRRNSDTTTTPLSPRITGHAPVDWLRSLCDSRLWLVSSSKNSSETTQATKCWKICCSIVQSLVLNFTVTSSSQS